MMRRHSSGATDAASMPVLDIDGARATIRLNRPKHLNRLQPEDLDALVKLFDRIEADPALRVLVLTGTGRAFSAGYDLGSIAERTANAQEQTAGSAFEIVVNRLEDLAVPTICRINGGVYGGKRVLGGATVEAMLADQNKQLGHPWGLGWGLKASTAWNAFGELSSERTFGHSGATGTVAWADPERELLCVILTTRPWTQDKGFLLRRLANVVQAAIE